jgi:hypothetical protein
MEFRVAAFYRLLDNIQSVSSTDPEFEKSLMDELLFELEKKITPTLENLGNMIMQMNVHNQALAEFPFDDLTVVADMVLYLVNYYKAKPTLSYAITARLTGTNKRSELAQGGYICPLESVRQDGRTVEIVSLNNQFTVLSKMDGLSSVSAEFFENKNHPFHPASQFVRITT